MTYQQHRDAGLPVDPATGRAVIRRGLALAPLGAGPRLIVQAQRDRMPGRVAIELETGPRRSAAFLTPTHARAVAAQLAELATLAELYGAAERREEV